GDLLRDLVSRTLTVDQGRDQPMQAAVQHHRVALGQEKYPVVRELDTIVLFEARPVQHASSIPASIRSAAEGAGTAALRLTSRDSAELLFREILSRGLRRQREV